MSVKIGLVSDIHATIEPLLQALEIFRQQDIETILCPGDIVGYGSESAATVELLVQSGCRSILGNHDLWWLEDFADQENGPIAAYLGGLPRVEELQIEEHRIVMVHGSPPASVMEGIRLLDEDGRMIEELRAFWCAALTDFEADVLVVGHTHQVFAEQLGGTLVINPGSTRFNHSCAILHLPELRVEFLPLGGHGIEPVWNWGMQFRR
ncbi:MAG: metallophosphoesterase family protein [Desulfuromonadales bacterium]|nr:metallophosphoesterase family protein [Desulfuromonadales bacterium]NIS44054.1 metallophosphoesterase family protein [Desulfuromonadales bacterium]